jgi:superfamily I DNA/RNA helicase
MNRSLFVVGDDAQSIYGFRGSNIDLILGFEKHYPAVVEIILNQNYRSTQPILDLAEDILTHNENQKKKELFTDNPESIDVNYYHARNHIDEAEYIVRSLKKLYVEPAKIVYKEEETDETVVEYDKEEYIESGDSISSMFDRYLSSDIAGAPTRTFLKSYTPGNFSFENTDWSKVQELNNVAILYRTHSQSRSLEEVFVKHGLPYKLVSGTKFLERREIKDVIAILKLLSNNSDSLAYSRVIPILTTGIGAKGMQDLMRYREDETFVIKPKLLAEHLRIISIINSYKNSMGSLTDITENLLKRLNYFEALKATALSKEDFLAREENIRELSSLMVRFEVEGVGLMDQLTNFLAEIALMTNQDDASDDSPKISLMSLHQSKGLEYETVFLVGIEDNLLPHLNAFSEPGGLEEEVRLAYVGVTRAKRHLYLISAESRIQFGNIIANPVSRIFRPFLANRTKRSF